MGSKLESTAMSEHGSSSPQSRWGDNTKLVRGGLDRSPHGETSEAMYLNSGFVYDEPETAEKRFAGEDPGYIYGRYGNPTVSMFEERLRLIEGAEACYAVASGMSAVFGSLACMLKAGDHVVSSRALFGSCYQVITNILPRFGIRYTLVDGADLDGWRKAVTPGTAAIFLETPSNPGLDVIDIAAVCDIGRAQGARVVVDNVFATPVLQRPLSYGADVVVYSGTKHMDGQGRVLGGAILGANELMNSAYKDMHRHTGPALSPFNAWVLLKGLETLDLRVRRQTETAGRVADTIAAHARVKQTIYPGRPDHPQAALIANQMTGGGNVIAFDLGDRAAAWRFLDALQIVDISNNLGDAKSMATHPCTTTHRSMPETERLEIGLTEGWVRMSVGLEGAGDLVRDVSRALDGA